MYTHTVHCISHGSNLAGGDTVKALTPFSNAKKATQNVRVFVMQPGRLVEYAHQCDLLFIHPYILIDQARTRFLTLGDAAIRMSQQLPAVVPTIRAVVASADTSSVRIRGNAILRSITSKSYLICLSIEAMVVNTVNIMNRSNQGRRVNFSSYRADLDRTTTRLEAMRDGNEVMKWLEYRLEQTPPLRACYPQFTKSDFELGQRRTVLFIDLFILRLNKRIPQLAILARFDVLQPTSMPRDPEQMKTYGVDDILHLFRFFIVRRKPQLKVCECV